MMEEAKSDRISKILDWAVLKSWPVKRRLIFLDVVLVITTFVMIFSEGGVSILLFHLVFIFLTLGAFYWNFRAFITHSLFWVTLTTAFIMISALFGTIHPGELIEIPMLTIILILVFVIAEQRARAEEALRRTNEKLEQRVAERTAELTHLNTQLVQEITERKRTEAELHRTAVRSQAILNLIPDSIFQLARGGELLDYKVQSNDLPYRASGVIQVGNHLREMLPPDLVELTQEYIERALYSGIPQVFEYQLTQGKDTRDFEARLVVSSSNEVLMIIRDITARKARAIALERQRSRIARDLHDSLGQNLGYLHLKLDEFASTNLIQSGPEFQQQLVQMRGVANKAYELVRNMIAATRLANSEDLATALLAQAKSASHQAGFEVQLASTGQPYPLSPVVQPQVIYLFQEALNNIAKHAQASLVTFKLDWAADRLTISLSDDGAGFELESPPSGEHFGLIIMQERAEEIGGSLLINSRPGQGTTITLAFPTGRPAEL